MLLLTRLLLVLSAVTVLGFAKPSGATSAKKVHVSRDNQSDGLQDIVRCCIILTTGLELANMEFWIGNVGRVLAQDQWREAGNL
jgi:hypothetical protein